MKHKAATFKALSEHIVQQTVANELSSIIVVLTVIYSFR